MSGIKKINILFVLPSLKRGGAEMQVIDLLRWFDRGRFNVFLFTFSEDISLLENISQLEITHQNKPRKSKFDLSMISLLSSFIKDNDIEVIHCTLQIGLMIAWLASLYSRRNSILVNTLHRTVGRNLKEEILERVAYQWPMRACSSVICVCKNQEKYWLKKFPFLKSKTQVIYNGVDINKFNPSNFTKKRYLLRRELNIPDSAIVYVCIAGFRIEKNHIGLLDAFNIAHIKHPDTYLLLAGDGAERNNIETHIKNNNAGWHIQLLGNVEDVRPLLSAADTSIISSTTIETFSIAMLESMSMETPVITTNIGGHTEAIIENKTGKVVEIGSTLELSNAMIWLYENRDKISDMGRNARQMVTDCFTVQGMVKHTEDLILERLK